MNKIFFFDGFQMSTIVPHIFNHVQLGFLSAKLLVKRETRTPYSDCLNKDTIPLYAWRQFVMYKLKIVTHVYMKL